MPNVAANVADIRTNAEYIRQLLENKGISARLLTIDDPKAPPAVYGEYIVPRATKTIIFYAHYDGQPTDPADWKVTEPWKPMLLTNAAEKGGKNTEIPKGGGRITWP